MVRKTAFALIALCAIILAFTSKSNPLAQSGFAVVELFTSEGCSSCPPADALIAKLAIENKDKPVYILAYHVDYWDRLGWKDTFSDHRYAQRQNQYANWLNLSSVYTPQIVVNGSREFVGSDEKTLRASVLSSLSEINTNNLEISLEKQSDINLTLNYHTNQSTQGFNLLIAFIKPNAIHKIERGENRGKTLAHVQIVRNLDRFSLNGKENGLVTLSTLKEITQSDPELIAFLQNAKTGKITAATKFKIRPSHS